MIIDMCSMDHDFDGFPVGHQSDGHWVGVEESWIMPSSVICWNSEVGWWLVSFDMVLWMVPIECDRRPGMVMVIGVPLGCWTCCGLMKHTGASSSSQQHLTWCLDQVLIRKDDGWIAPKLASSNSQPSLPHSWAVNSEQDLNVADIRVGCDTVCHSV